MSQTFNSGFAVTAARVAQRATRAPSYYAIVTLAVIWLGDSASDGMPAMYAIFAGSLPPGRMMIQMVGSFAEFERAMILERTSAGLAVARAEGRVGGRRKKLDTAKRREIAESVITGCKSGADMARLYNVCQRTVPRIIARGRGDVRVLLATTDVTSVTSARQRAA